jgi:cystathionine gamma-synthase
MKQNDATNIGFGTRAVHVGQDSDPTTGAVTPPIYLTSTFEIGHVGGMDEGFAYSRVSNPNRQNLGECIASLEGGTHGFACASGLAAEDSFMRTVLAPGDHVVIPHDTYGGSFRLFDQVLPRWGITYTSVAQHDLDAVEAAFTPATKLVWMETPTNPLLHVADISAVSEMAHGRGALVAVDNTFCSPYLQQPLAYGADAVIHSTTKYICGHSDVVGGAIVVADTDLADRISLHQKTMGSIAGPMDAWLTLRGLRTLPLRMEKHCDNAEQVVDFLQNHSAVTEVYYPGLDAHPGHDAAKRQMSRYGGMVSFRVNGPEEAARVCESTELFRLAVSLGGVESLIEAPALMTHRSASGSSLAPPLDLVRLSVGIENIEDIIADLDRVLTR